MLNFPPYQRWATATPFLAFTLILLHAISPSGAISQESAPLLAQSEFYSEAPVVTGAPCCSWHAFQHELKYLVERLPPPGNLGLRYPYGSSEDYYYARPYNAGMVLNASLSDGDPRNHRLPYSNQLFENVFQQVESEFVIEQLSSAIENDPQQARKMAVFSDKYLEYRDWQDHRASRIQWQQAQQVKPNLKPIEPISGGAFQPVSSGQ